MVAGALGALVLVVVVVEAAPDWGCVVFVVVVVFGAPASVEGVMMTSSSLVVAGGGLAPLHLDRQASLRGRIAGFFALLQNWRHVEYFENSKNTS